MRKPRVLETRSRKNAAGGRKPKVVEEKDYSLLLEKREPENVLLGKGAMKRGERQPAEGPSSCRVGDSARDRLREDMLADITPVRPPLPEPELGREIEADRKKRGGLGRKIKKFIGLE